MVLGQYMALVADTLVVLGHYKLVLLGTRWYRVNIGLLCLLILRKWRITKKILVKKSLLFNVECKCVSNTF